jgi:hypothetical protein
MTSPGSKPIVTSSNVVRYPLHLRVYPGFNRRHAVAAGREALGAASRREEQRAVAGRSDGPADEEAAGARAAASESGSVPEAFTAWLRCLSMPTCRIEPHLVSNPEVTHGKRKSVSATNQLVRLRAAALGSWLHLPGRAPRPSRTIG